MTTKEIMDNCHLTISHKGQLFDIDEIAGMLLEKEVYDQDGSEFKILEIKDNTATIEQTSHWLHFTDGEYSDEHVMEITGHIDGEYFVPDCWKVKTK